MINDSKYEYLTKEDVFVIQTFHESISHPENNIAQNNEDDKIDNSSDMQEESHLEKYTGNVYCDPNKKAQLNQIIENYDSEQSKEDLVKNIKSNWLKLLRTNFENKRKFEKENSKYHKCDNLSLSKISSSAKKYWSFIEKYELNVDRPFQKKYNLEMMIIKYNLFMEASKDKGQVDVK